MPDNYRPVAAGELRHQVQLQRATSSSSAATLGQETLTWSTIGTYRALVTPLQGRELFNAQQIKATISHSVIMRNIGPVYATDRLLFSDTTYTTRVLNIDVVMRRGERDREYDIMASEQQGVTS